jgi:hypothetical protein
MKRIEPGSNRFLLILALLSAIIGFPIAVTPAFADSCTAPTPPGDIPDGATATKSQMIEAKHRLDAYNSQMNDFLDCNKAEMNSSIQPARNVQLNNAKVDELERYVGCFNDQLTAYKQTGGGSYGRPVVCPMRAPSGEEIASSGLPPNPGPSGADVAATLIGAAAQGAQQGLDIKNQNRANGATTQAYAPPPTPTNTNQSSGGNGFTYDKGLNNCVKLGGDGKSVYFDNGCNASLTILVFQKGYAGSELDCGPNTRCTFAGMGFGYTRQEDFSYAVCPKGDGVLSANGYQWQGTGAFTCRRQ